MSLSDLEFLKSESEAKEGLTTDSEVLEASKFVQIKETNERLKKENALLKSQFDEAMDLTHQMESMRKQITVLNSEITNYRTKTEDLDRRLKLSIQANEDLEDRLAEERRSKFIQNNECTSSRNKEVEKIRSQCKAQLDDVLNQLEQAQSQSQQNDVSHRTLLSHIDHTLQNASHFFETEITSLEALNSVFEKGQVIATKTTLSGTTSTGIPVPTQNSEVAKLNNDLQKRLRHTKGKLNQSNKDFANAQTRLLNLQKDHESQVLTLKKQISSLQSQLEDSKASACAVEKSNQVMISKLQNKIEQLKDQQSRHTMQVSYAPPTTPQITAQSSYPQHATNIPGNSSTPSYARFQPLDSETIPVNPLSPGYVQPSQTCSGNCPAAEQFLQRFDNVNEQLIDVQKQRDLLGDKLRIAEIRNQNLLNDLDSAKSEIGGLKTVNEQSLAEIQGLRTALHTRQVVVERKEIEKKGKPKPNPLVPKLEAARKALHESEIALDKAERMIESQRQEMNEMREVQTSLEAKAKSAHDDLVDYKIRHENEPKITPEDILPLEAWQVEELPPRLAAEIAQVASNFSLQPVTKVQTALRAATKYYSTEIGARDKALDEAYSENQAISSAVNQFLVDASIALCDKATTFEDFFKQNSGSAIVNDITNLRHAYDQAKHENERITAVLEKFSSMNSKFGNQIALQQGEDPIQAAHRINNELAAKDQMILCLKKKVKQSKQQLNQLQADIGTKGTSLKDEFTRLSNENSELGQQNESLAQALNNLQKENAKLKTDLEEANQRVQEADDDIEQQIAINKQLIEGEKAQIEQELRIQIQQSQQTVQRLSVQLSESQENMNKMKRLIATMKQIKEQDEKEMEKLKNEKEEIAKDTVIQVESAKAAIQASLAESIAQLTKQCEAHRADVAKLAGALAEAENQVEIGKKDLQKAKSCKQKVQIELHNLKEQAERDQKLAESQIKAAKIAAQVEGEKAIEQLKAKQEEEKQKLITFGIDSFRNFFSPSDSMDERTYFNVVDRATKEINKLTRADRRIRQLLQVGDRQTTEDAVAQLLMKQ